jgi:hypothetical protein
MSQRESEEWLYGAWSAVGRGVGAHGPMGEGRGRLRAGPSGLLSRRRTNFGRITIQFSRREVGIRLFQCHSDRWDWVVV